MKTKIYQEYLPLLAKKHAVLLLGNNHIESFEAVKNQFDVGIQRNITPSALEHLSNTLMHNKIDIVILDTDMPEDTLINFVDKVTSFNEAIKIVLIYDEKNFQNCLPVVSYSTVMVERNLCPTQLLEKLFLLLSLHYTIDKLAQHTSVLKQKKNVDLGGMDEFFDTYEGEALFLIEDMKTIFNGLRDGELSEGIIKESAEKLKSVAEIFEHHVQMQKMPPILLTLAGFLESLDLSQIEPSGLKAFDYLAAILDDVSGTLLNMFVDRIFTDIYIVEHSLENNIDFMRNALLGFDDTSSELDFF